MTAFNPCNVSRTMIRVSLESLRPYSSPKHPLQTTFFAVSVTMSIRATDKFVVGVACERAVGFSAQVGLVKAGHASPSRRRLPHLT